MKAVTFSHVPGYTVDLLLAAKNVLASQEPAAMAELEQAVIAFEAEMPVRQGVVQTPVAA